MKNIFVITLIFITFISCSKEEETVDLRTSAVGSYNYSFTLDFYDDNDQIILTEKENGIFEVVKSETDTDRLNFIEDDEIFLYGNKITGASNGFTFDIPKQTDYEEEIGKVEYEGYDAVVLGETLFHGGFFNDSNKLELSMIITFEDELPSGYYAIGSLECTKK